jgi:hypothetical protein
VNAIVTIFKSEFKDKPSIEAKLQTISSVTELGEAKIYLPDGGKLIEFLTMLKDNSISYGTHFKSSFEE